MIDGRGVFSYPLTYKNEQPKWAAHFVKGYVFNGYRQKGYDNPL